MPDIPPESRMLKDSYRQSGMTVADLAAESSMSVAAVQIALDGRRYRGGVARAVVPPDSTVVKLAAALRIESASLREVGRSRAAELLDEVRPPEEGRRKPEKSSREPEADLAQRILSAFSTEELVAELNRREHEEYLQEAQRDIADELEVERWPL